MNSFEKMHPIVPFVYLCIVIGFGMIIMNPFYLTSSVICSFIALFSLEGRRVLKRLLFSLPVLVIITLINPLFNTNGNTVIFTYFNRPFTLEALMYGFMISMMCATVINWFSIFNMVITSDKFIHIFGKLLPSSSLLLTMVMRFIPMYQKQFVAINNSMRCIGKGVSKEYPFKKNVFNSLELFSCLLSVSLESAVTTSDSMKSRGYGLTGKTSYSVFKHKKSDSITLVIIVLSSILISSIMLLENIKIEVIPSIVLNKFNFVFFAGLSLYTLFLLLPSLYIGIEEIKWNILKSKI